MRRPLSALTLACMACLLLIGARPVPTHAEPERLLHLRRASFDPLRRPPAPSAYARGAARSQLRVVQLDGLVGAETPSLLRAAGLEPLVYVPDNAFVVRIAEGARGPEALADLRWSGALDPIHKLAPELDRALAAGGDLDLRLQATPDRDGADLRAAVVAAGGRPLNSGALLRARVPASAVPALAARDDLLWVEPDAPLRLHNSEARDILGVQELREDTGLDGSGQLVAVTDTGLDIQGNVQSNTNGDFPANRIARGYSRAEMDEACSTLDEIYEPNNWSDRNGHGTHVAGTVLGTGALAAGSQAGMAPGARLVVQAVSTGGSSLNCLDFDTFMPLAYSAGARIQNLSFGGGTPGDYGSFSQLIDDFVWAHKDHLVVVSAGNDGEDCLPATGSGGCGGDGVIDPASVTDPATAKNVISVGASENNRPPSTPGCASSPQERKCWSYFSLANPGLGHAPLGTDNISDNPLGMAAFSSRGPADDGRLKPELAAPGTNIVSARSHHSEAGYPALFGSDYAYDSGTSMAAPMVSGLAALARQWLAQQGTAAPSAALVKALLLNGAADLAPGQYGEGTAREIPAAWPNNVQGWGRASILGAVGRGDLAHRYWEHAAGLQTGGSATYGLTLAAGQTVRATLVWTDPPGSPLTSKVLVNDLDLELLGPGGEVLAKGNAAAPMPASCRDVQGFDRCNNAEGIALSAPAAGSYTLRVRGFVTPQGPQPFALAVGTPPSARVVAPTSAPAPVEASVAAGSPLVTVSWGGLDGVRSYEVLVTTPEGPVVYTTAQTNLTFVGVLGSSDIEVRACNSAGCGPYSASVEVTVSVPPRRVALPQIRK